MAPEFDKQNKPHAISGIGIAFTIIWALLAAILLSDSGLDIISYLKAFAFSLVWGIVWASRLVRFGLQSRKNKAIRRDAPSPVIFWGFEPIAFLLIAALVYSDTLMLARFYLSSAALEKYVHEVQDGKIDMPLEFEFGHPARSVGLYSIFLTETMRPNGGIQFLTSGDGISDRAGFAYYPNGQPPHRDKNLYTHIYGPWWKWQEHF